MKVNRFLHFFDTVAIVLFAITLILLSSTVTSAADGYTLIWSAERYVYTDGGHYLRAQNYRHVRILRKSNGNVGSDFVCLGPAEWQVKGTLPDGTGFTERWQADSWNDVGMNWDSHLDMRYEYQTVSGCNSSWGAISNSNYSNWAIKPDGEYGAMVIATVGSSNVYKDHWQSASSWPTSWTVHGCVYDTNENGCPFNTR